MINIINPCFFCKKECLATRAPNQELTGIHHCLNHPYTVNHRFLEEGFRFFSFGFIKDKINYYFYYEINIFRSNKEIFRISYRDMFTYDIPVLLELPYLPKSFTPENAEEKLKLYLTFK